MVTALTEVLVIRITSLYIASYNQLVLEVINFEKSTIRQDIGRLHGNTQRIITESNIVRDRSHIIMVTPDPDDLWFALSDWN
jgi:hypothetical protein